MSIILNYPRRRSRAHLTFLPALLRMPLSSLEQISTTFLIHFIIVKPEAQRSSTEQRAGPCGILGQESHTQPLKPLGGWRWGSPSADTKLCPT